MSLGSVLGTVAGGIVGTMIEPGVGTAIGAHLGGKIGGKVGGDHKEAVAPASSDFVPQMGSSFAGMSNQNLNSMQFGSVNGSEFTQQ